MSLFGQLFTMLKSLSKDKDALELCHCYCLGQFTNATGYAYKPMIVKME